MSQQNLQIAQNIRKAMAIHWTMPNGGQQDCLYTGSAKTRSCLPMVKPQSC